MSPLMGSNHAPPPRPLEVCPLFIETQTFSVLLLVIDGDFKRATEENMWPHNPESSIANESYSAA